MVPKDGAAAKKAWSKLLKESLIVNYAETGQRENYERESDNQLPREKPWLTHKRSS